MKKPDLNRSIAVIFILMIFIVMEHLLQLLIPDQTQIAPIVDPVLMLFNILYFVQLQNNLSRRFSINNVRYMIRGIIVSYVIIILVIITLAIINRGNPFPKPDELHISLFAIYLITSVYSTVQFCILGYRLTKNNSLSYLKAAGYLYLFLKPLSYLAEHFFAIFSSLKMYSHLGIIVEFIPLWLVYKQYKELMAKENAMNEIPFITNASVIADEDKTAGSNKPTI